MRRQRQGYDEADDASVRRLAHAPQDFAFRMRDEESEHIETIMMITQCPHESRARACLASARGDVERAISIYFDTEHHFTGVNDIIFEVGEDGEIREVRLQQQPQAAAARAAPVQPAAPVQAPLQPAAQALGHPAVVPFGNPAVVPFGNPAVVPFGHPAVVPFGHPAVGPFGNPAVGFGHPAVGPFGNPAVGFGHPAAAQTLGQPPAPRDFGRQQVAQAQGTPHPARPVLPPQAVEQPQVVVDVDLPYRLWEGAIELKCLEGCDELWAMDLSEREPKHNGQSILGAFLFMRCDHIEQARVLSPWLFAAVLDLRARRHETVQGAAGGLLLSGTCPPRCNCPHELHQLLFDVCNSQTRAVRCRIVEVLAASRTVRLIISCRSDNASSGVKSKVCCVAEEKQSVMSLIKLITNSPWDFSPAIRPSAIVGAAHERLALTLRPYQQESVSHMLHVEQRGHASLTTVKVREQLYLSFSATTGIFRVSLVDPCYPLAHDGLLSDEMGLGKTLCCIATAVHNPPCAANMPRPSQLESRHFIPGTLVLATVSLVGQWEQEIMKSCPRAKLCRYYGTSRHKISASDLAKFDFIVTTTHTGLPDLRRPRSLLSRCWLHRIVVDEFHLIRSTPRDIKSTYLWCVSGTPCRFTLTSFMQRRPGMAPTFVPDRESSMSSKWASFEYNRDPRIPVLADPAVAGTYDRKLIDGYLAPVSPVPTIRHTKQELPPEQIALPPRQFVTDLFDLTPNESILYKHTIAPLVQNLRQMSRAAIIENHGTIRNWLTILREIAVDASQSGVQDAGDVVGDFNVERANDRAEVQQLTPAEARAMFNGPRSYYIMNDALGRLGRIATQRDEDILCDATVRGR